MLQDSRTIILLAVLFVPVVANSADITISGRIVDRSGQPVSGVRFTVPGGTSVSPAAPANPLSIPKSRLFPGVPAECLHFSSLTSLRTNAQGDYQLHVVFDENRSVSGSLSHKTCADYRAQLTEGNMKLVPHPDDVRKYDLHRARGALPLPTSRTKTKNVRQQVQPAGSPAPRGGFLPR